MSTLRDLTAYLKEHLPQIEPDRFESEQVGPSKIATSMTRADTQPDTWLLYREYYEGVIYIEGWTHPKELILSHLAAWLIGCADERDPDELGEPEVEPLHNDDDSTDILITIPFMEPVHITPDPEGDLLIDGLSYRRVHLQPDTAHEFELGGKLGG